MIDLSNYNVNVNKPLTQAEFDERIKKGLIKSGDIVEVYNAWGYPVKTEHIVIPPPMSDAIKYYELTNWKTAKQLYLTHRHIWEKFKAKGQIPYDVLNEVEKESKNNEYNTKN